jgi:hypothetical protein
MRDDFLDDFPYNRGFTINKGLNSKNKNHYISFFVPF